MRWMSMMIWMLLASVCLGDDTEKLQELLNSKEDGVITIPAGEYTISGPLLEVKRGRKLTIQGEGPRATIIRLRNSCEDPIIRVPGDDKFMNSWVSIENLTFDGDGHQATWVEFDHSLRNFLSRVEFFNTIGTVLRGNSWWDSTVRECSFIQCGNNQDPAVQLKGVSPKDWYWNCNNIKFVECHFESNHGVSLDMGDYCRKIIVSNCKFHGKLDGTAPDLPHIYASKSTSLMFTNNNLTYSGGDGFYLKACSGCALLGNMVDTNKGVGVSMNDGSQAVLHGNVFGTGGQKNGRGDFLQ